MSARGRDGGGETPAALSGEDLVALLYGELDGDDAARTGSRVEADPALSAQLGDMRRVRELFSSMADEEPPNRLTAQLLAEAARSAPQVRSAAAPAEAGLWARFVSWLQPLVQRPALAAAASLVLVAGVAGVLYMRKGEELTSTAPEETTTSSEPADVTGEATAQPEAPPPPVSAATPADTGMAEGATQGQADENAAAESAKSDSVKRPARESSRHQKAVGGIAAGDKKRSVEKAPPKPAVKSGTVYGLSEQEMVPREEQPSVDQAGPGGGGGAAPEQKKSEDRAPAAEPAPAPQATPHADSKPSAPRVDARTLHQRAIDAALDQRCDEVRSLAGQVRAADPGYYAKSFVTDTRLKGCLSGGSTKKATKK